MSAASSPPTTSGPDRRDWTIFFLLVAVTLLVYGRVVANEFVDYDVEDYITGNPNVRSGLSWENVEWAFTQTRSANWHPLTWLSHMLDCELWGLRPRPHHLTNVVLHGLNAGLLFLALSALGGWKRGLARGLALATAGLFAVHPLRVESVAWAAERKDVLSGLFFMLTLLAWAGYARRPSLRSYTLVFLALGLGLLAKPMLVSVPFVLLLFDVWPLARHRRPKGPGPWSLVTEKLPLFALVGAASTVTFLVQIGSGAGEGGQGLGLVARGATALMGYGFYLEKTIWPTGLACFYPHPALLSQGKLEPLALPALAVLAILVLLSVGCWFLRRKAPYLAVGGCLFLGMLVPVIGLVQVGHQGWADRYAYLPTIGLNLALAYGVGTLLTRFSPRLAWGVFAVVVVSLGSLTWRQIGVWKNSTSLYEHALAVTEKNHVMHFNYGRALMREGRYDEAEAELEKAVRLNQGFYGAWLSLGLVLAQKDDPQKARLAFQNALIANPGYAEARRELGLVLARLGEAAEAKHELGLALEANPADADAHYTLSVLYAQERDFARAETHTREALRARPRFVQALANLGAICAETGRAAEARGYLRQALELDPNHVEARRNLQLLDGGS